MEIKVRYLAVDGYQAYRRFKTLKGARQFATERVGVPEIACGYAISADGIGRITVSGCTLEELFHGTVENPGLGFGPYALWEHYPRFGSRDEIVGYSKSLVARYLTREAAEKVMQDAYEAGTDSTFHIVCDEPEVEPPIPYDNSVPSECPF
jgi:hypothetical protein